jgi:hypothetical protein
MNTTRSFDFLDLLVGTQKEASGNAPTKSSHYIGVSILEADVMTSGAAILALIKANPYINYISHIAIGTDATPVNPAQTGLIAEYSRWPLDLFLSNTPATTGLFYSQVYQCLFPKGVTPPGDCQINIKEIGLFGDADASQAGATLFCRQLLSYDNRTIGAGGTTTPVDLMINAIFSFLP